MSGIPAIRSAWALMMALVFAGGCAPRSDCHKASFSTEAASCAEHAALAAHMSRRLELAESVAWSKFHSGHPVDDPQREKRLLELMMNAAAERGMDRRWIGAFFRAQIEASKHIQRERIAAWKSGAKRPARPPADLSGAIRPQLDRVGAQLMGCLEHMDRVDLAALDRELKSRGWSSEVAGIATAFPARP